MGSLFCGKEVVVSGPYWWMCERCDGTGPRAVRERSSIEGPPQGVEMAVGGVPTRRPVGGHTGY